MQKKAQKENVTQQTPPDTIFEAISRFNYPAFQKMIADNKDAHLQRSPLGNDTPLIFAATKPDREALPMISALIAAKADLNASDNQGKTAIHHAVLYGRVQILNALLEAKAEVNQSCQDNITWEDSTLLELAVNRGDEEAVRLLLAYKATLNGKELVTAAKNGNPNIMNALLQRAVKTNTKLNKLGLLHYAIDSQHPEVVKALLDAEAEAYQSRGGMIYPLHYALGSNGSPAMVQLLADAKADMSHATDMLLGMLSDNYAGPSLQQVQPLLVKLFEVKAAPKMTFPLDEQALRQMVKNPLFTQYMSALFAAKGTLETPSTKGMSTLELAEKYNMHQKVLDMLHRATPDLSQTREASSSKKERPARQVDNPFFLMARHHPLFDPQVLRLPLRIAGVEKPTAPKPELVDELEAEPPTISKTAVI